METPVCFSQCYVNKQNLRSFGSILKSRILKENDIFLQHIFEDDALVSELSEDLINVLTTLKDNIKIRSKEDFRNYFSDIVIVKSSLQSVNKRDVFDNCMKALYEIVPKYIFGNNHNYKIFRRLIKIVIYSMKGQHILIDRIVNNWNVTVDPWKAQLETSAYLILRKLLEWIIKYVLSPMISLNFYVTTCKLDLDEYKLHYFWKYQWQSFYDKTLSDMMIAKVIERYTPNCIGKRSKKNHSHGDRLKLKTINKDIPKLHLILKPNDYRPIVRYKNAQNPSEKYKFKERLNFLKTLRGKGQAKLELQFHNMYNQWINLDKPKLYFVKSDLSNAFGSIIKEKLIRILSMRHLSFQKKEKNLNFKKKIAQHYKEMMTEIRKPLLVRTGSTVFEWKEGLVQGYKYSPALSELYYTHLDEEYFSELLKSEAKIRLFLRIVDDYLYVTDSLADAHKFLNALANYRNVNYLKTVVNFKHPTIQFDEDITFVGYKYDTRTLQISRASNVYSGQMCFKIAFTHSLADLGIFLENRIGQSGIQINGHIFNLHYNKEELIWKHVFTTFCLSANKFCTILAVCDEIDMSRFIEVYKRRVTVKLCNAIINTLRKNLPVDVLFFYCINHFRYLSYLALMLCVKGTSKCSSLLPLVNIEMTRTNCLFGKWRDHASSINTNGDMKRKAVKEVCRRLDLRVIFKQFYNLPYGFECYNNFYE